MGFVENNTDKYFKMVFFVFSFIVPEVSMKKVVRIKVKRGNSSLDLNDPAVKEAILEQVHIMSMYRNTSQTVS